jgi:hypothetical protein
MTERSIQALQESEAVLEWSLRNASRSERLGDIEQAALWGYTAAGIATEFGHSHLCSAPLESQLLRLGKRLPFAETPGHPRSTPHGQRWLHVFTMTAAIGGHTAIGRRWIERNPFGQRHSALLTAQSSADIDPSLARAVERSGGEIHSLALTDPLLRRAEKLRQLARSHADVVVLHVHEWDVLPSLAFAVPGGPPVLLMNHADHAFWVGCAVSDIVVDFRDSGLSLSTSIRGVRGSAVLPVPLEDLGPAARARKLVSTRLRDPSLLSRGLIFLTIGGPQKYRPHGHLDFGTTIARVFDTIDDCALFAVGPGPADPPWPQIAERTGGRAVAVGLDPDLAPWHGAADIYLESFPVGSYTALLEVGLAERAFVRKPWLVPPSVLALDGGALAAFAPPADPSDYAASVISLAGDPERRKAAAFEARRAVLASHCGDAWDARLEALQRTIPLQHDAGFGFEPRPMPEPLADYSATLHTRRLHGSPLAFAQETAQRQGLAPRTDVALLEAMRRLQR